MKRRGFLGALAASAAAFALDPERALWVPGAKTISIPALQTLKPFCPFCTNIRFMHQHPFPMFYRDAFLFRWDAVNLDTFVSMYPDRRSA